MKKFNVIFEMDLYVSEYSEEYSDDTCQYILTREDGVKFYRRKFNKEKAEKLGILKSFKVEEYIF